MKKVMMIMVVGALFTMQGCKDQAKKNSESVQRGNPELRCDKPVEDKVNHTFTLALSADSTADASVVFYLIDCGDTLMMESGQSVTFSGIAPLDDGYDVAMRVEWPDTVVMKNRHVTGFILTPEPVDSLSAKELQELINAQDKSIKCGSNEHLSQSVKIIVNDALRTPKKLSEVIDCISFKEWKSVIVTDVGYDENNLIISVTLKPVGEKPLPESDDDEDGDFVIYDD